MSKKLRLSLIAVLLITCSLALCLASCGKVTKINLNDDDETNKKPTPTETQLGGGVGLVIDPNQGDYVAPETETQLGIAIPGWGEITLPPNQTENIVVDFYNPEANEGKYYLSFELYLENEDGSKDILYKSNLIEPGKHIQKITLNHALEKGEYEAVIHVQPYKFDGTLAATNNLDAKCKLVVK